MNNTFDKVIPLIMDLEFTSPDDALHWNEGEVGYTFMGIYQKYNKEWDGWEIIAELKTKNQTLKQLSEVCYHDDYLKLGVHEIYYEQYWMKCKLNKIKSQKICAEIFCCAVNCGNSRAIKIAQMVTNTVMDGKIGNKTIKALNDFNPDKFDTLYDKAEREYYSAIVKRKPYLKRYIKGWYNRSKAV